MKTTFSNFFIFEEGKRPLFDSTGISLKLKSVQLTFENN